jgi:hypothetical protein
MKGAPPKAQDKGNKFLEAALRYAALGFRVIPSKNGQRSR